jgi:hypothetical protein
MVTGSGGVDEVVEDIEGQESGGGTAGSARAAPGRQSMATETVLKKPWRSAVALGPAQVFPIAPAMRAAEA